MLVFLKGAFCTGLTYWTWSEGLWGDSSKTEDLCSGMMKRIVRTINCGLLNNNDTNVNINNPFFTFILTCRHYMKTDYTERA